MAKNETTSKHVAAIAGRILKRFSEIFTADDEAIGPMNIQKRIIKICTVSDLKALAASALTQAPDKKKKSHGN